MWWGWLESNQLPRRYERPALTDELHPLVNERHKISLRNR